MTFNTAKKYKKTIRLFKSNFPGCAVEDGSFYVCMIFPAWDGTNLVTISSIDWKSELKTNFLKKPKKMNAISYKWIYHNPDKEKIEYNFDYTLTDFINSTQKSAFNYYLHIVDKIFKGEDVPKSTHSEKHLINSIESQRIKSE